MKRRALLCLATVAALVAFVALPGAANAQSTTAGPNAVTHWNEIAASTLVPIPGPAGGAPFALQINMGMTQGAVYDAINAITPKHHRPYLLKRRFSSTASREAAAATAAYRVLSNIVSTVPARIPFPNRDGLVAVARHAIRRVARGDTGLAVQDAGDRRGERRRRRDDRRTGGRRTLRAVAVGAELAAPGHWQPLLPNGTSPLDPTPWVGGVRPFLLQSSSQFRTAGPQALTSAAYAADFNEVKALGGDGVATTSTRTPDQTHNAIFWQSAGGPALLWNGVARDLAEDPAYALDLADSCASACDDEPERRGRGDQLLERQVPLRLLAAVARRSAKRTGTAIQRRRPTRAGRRS